MHHNGASSQAESRPPNSPGRISHTFNHFPLSSTASLSNPPLSSNRVRPDLIVDLVSRSAGNPAENAGESGESVVRWHGARQKPSAV